MENFEITVEVTFTNGDIHYSNLILTSSSLPNAYYDALTMISCFSTNFTYKVVAIRLI